MEWISVGERLPELDQDVLVYAYGNSYNGSDYKGIFISNLTRYYDDKDNGIEWVYNMTCGETVTHWMPLPELPKE